MKTNYYYSRTKMSIYFSITGVVTCISLVISLHSTKINKSDFYPITNYDTSYFNVIQVRDESLFMDIEDESLYELKYDSSELYLDTEKIEKAKRERIQREAEIKNKIREQNNPYGVILTTESKSDGTMAIPSDIHDTSFKGYMCMHKVTNRSTKQWKFLHSGEFEITSDSNGMLKYNNYYIVAMGSYYTDYYIGKTFRITLDTGVQFDVIVGDMKSDKHTDAANKYRPKGNNRGEVIEFIVACGETGHVCNKYDTLSVMSRRNGNLSYLGFKGNVKQIEKLSDNSVVDKLYN